MSAPLADPNPVPETCMPFHSPTRRLLDASQRSRVPLVFVALLLMATTAIAHGVAEDDAAFLKNSTGTNLPAFMYFGARHLVPGYDHLLFLFGVVFFFYGIREGRISRPEDH